MPELPEAETIARGLRPLLEGRTFEGVEVIHPDLLRQSPEAFAAALVGRRIHAVGRRGKNVVLHLVQWHERVTGSEPSPPAAGEESTTAGALVVHLGMTGRLDPDPGPSPGHLGVRFLLDGAILAYRDVRRFGELIHREPAEYLRWSSELGPEPLAPRFTARWLEAALTRSRSPVRSWLLDQRRIAGIGNIYALEALHRARIHPARPGRSLAPKEVRRLHRGLRAVLREAIHGGGTTIRDYRAADGSTGGHARALRVYGREGLPCPRCRMAVERAVFGNRSAFFCPRCQPPAARPLGEAAAG